MDGGAIYEEGEDLGTVSWGRRMRIDHFFLSMLNIQ